MQLAQLIETKEVSPVALAEALLERIARVDEKVNHFITVLESESLIAARKAEQEIMSGHYKGPLHGIPITLKDLFCTKGVRTTCASKVLEHHVPDRDAFVVGRLKEAGAYILGRLNMQEFAMGATGNISFFGPARNPWDSTRMTGGSSSGSGGSVAAHTSIAALGTDTGGSVRIPAALCGIVAHKPTYGLVSRQGIMPLAYTADHAGPMTKTAEDAALLLQVMAGYDPDDHSSVNRPIVDYRSALNATIKNLRIGLIKEVMEIPRDPEVSIAFERALGVFRELGVTMQEVSFRTFHEAQKVHPVIAISEASTAHVNTYFERRDDYGEEVRDRLDVAFLLTPSDYLVAQQARVLLQQDASEALRQVDVLVLPTCNIPAPLLNAREVIFPNGSRDKVIPALARNTRVWSDTGHPACSVPCGFAANHLPIGLQIVGKPFRDDLVLRVAHNFQRATNWQPPRPPL